MDLNHHSTFLDVDDAGIFDGSTDHDFAFPPSQSDEVAHHPPGTSYGYANPSGLNKPPAASRERTGYRDPAPQTQPRSVQRLNVEGPSSGGQPARDVLQTRLSGPQLLKESLERARRLQGADSRLSSLETR